MSTFRHLGQLHFIQTFPASVAHFSGILGYFFHWIWVITHNPYPNNPDLNKFQCIQLAYNAMQSGGTSPTILNIANDLSVELFLNEKIEFNHIPKLIELCITNHDYISEPCIDDIFAQIDWVKNHINKNTFIS